MIEVTKKKTAAKERAVKKALEPKLIGSFDTSVADVLKCVEEGREMFFTDGKYFLELPEDVFKSLPTLSQTRYSLAKRITKGEDVIANIAEKNSPLDYSYNKRHLPVGKQTDVTGKDPNYDYHWTRLDNRVDREVNGWEVDKNPNVKTHFDDGAVKTIGGSNKPEMVLMSIPKSVLSQQKEQRRKRRAAILENQKDVFRTTIEKMGSKVVGDDI